MLPIRLIQHMLRRISRSQTINGMHAFSTYRTEKFIRIAFVRAEVYSKRFHSILNLRITHVREIILNTKQEERAVRFRCED
jgi:hypothetical protein